MPGADSSFFKKSSLPYQFFSVFFLKESPDFGTSRNNHTVEKQLESWFLPHFPVLLEIDGKSHAFLCGKLYHTMGI